MIRFHRTYMQSGKIIIALGFILMVICSCNAGIKNLPALYGKKLFSPYRHMIGRNEILIFADSTFIYSGGGGAVHFTQGKWRVYDKNSIIITSGVYNLVPNKQLADTVLINFDNRIIRIKGRDIIELDGELYILKDPLNP
jgi:hypothetical protein